MVIKEGRYGKFLACPNYPDCKNVKSFGEVVAKCPRCGGNVMKKKSKKGKFFFACNNYPKCTFISWDLPAPFLCPKCESVVKMSKTANKTIYICTSRECDFKKDAPNAAAPQEDAVSNEK
jgi:DNA topoisomerase-1